MHKFKNIQGTDIKEIKLWEGKYFISQFLNNQKIFGGPLSEKQQINYYSN